MSSKGEHGDLWGRRDVMTSAGWLGLGLSGLISAGGFLRLLFRRAPVEPPTVFRAGRPADYAPGSVSERYVKDWRVFVVREEDRLYAVHARCTHLGCTPRWRALESKFKCPCHGSGFRISGVNFEGPAPEPLYRLKVWLDRDGALAVDVGRRFSKERWDDPDAFVQLGGGTA